MNAVQAQQIRKRRASIMQWFLISLRASLLATCCLQVSGSWRISFRNIFDIPRAWKWLRTKQFPQNYLVLPSKVLIRSAIYEGVNGTAQINQEPVCEVGLSRQRLIPAHGINVIDYTNRNPAKRETGHHRR